jgi:DNA mismatch repair protein MutL
MSDIIQILPDVVANQIAAGEVIQRPASAVKELMENAVDSGADDIQLIIKDSGKTLVQVIDNGCGMSPTDARRSFERHATSKIRNADDLFSIRTFGFRGEALASIAAISHTEMRTRRREDELGSLIEVEGGVVKKQEACGTETGTSLSIKNIFFNVPARRNFLKSDNAEYAAILEEFNRVALAYPEIGFTLFNNGKQISRLTKGNLKQRILGIFGNTYAQRLVNLEENAGLVSFTGFIGRPEFARKTRGEQYFLVNRRFIRHHFFHHAIEQAYAELIAEKSYPSYFIHITVDTEQIDVNIHPTKTEVKFRDDKVIYTILKTAVKKSLGQFSIRDGLDFDTERSFEFDFSNSNRPVKIPTITVDPTFNPFEQKDKSSGNLHQPVKPTPLQQSNHKNWEKLFDETRKTDTETEPSVFMTEESEKLTEGQEEGRFLLIYNRYILTPSKSGLLVIDRRAATEKILFERYMQKLSSGNPASQQLLFPVTITLSPADTLLLESVLDEIRAMGFSMEPFGGNTFVVNGLPAGSDDSDVQGGLETMLEHFRSETTDSDKKRRLALSLARSQAARDKHITGPDEMQALTGQLFACPLPDTSPSGKKTLFRLEREEIEKRFKL